MCARACGKQKLVSYQAEIDSLQCDFNRRNMFDLLCIVRALCFTHFSIWHFSIGEVICFSDWNSCRILCSSAFILNVCRTMIHLGLKNSDQSSVRIELTRISGEIRHLNPVWHDLRSYIKTREALFYTFCSRYV